MTIYALGEARPVLPPEGDYWIAPNATLIGRVRVKKGANIWFGAVLRGDTDWINVGENTNIQDGAILHTDEGISLDLGVNVTVGHGVVLHGASVGDKSLIGMNATLLNRVKVGANCIVGAHALLPEGKEYPDGSLIVGVPARVARRLTDEEMAFLSLSAAHYVANARRFAPDLKSLKGEI